MAPLRVLTVCHNHPALHPGGTEIFAHELFRALRASGEVDGLFLACTSRLHREQKPGTCFQTVGPSADEAVLWVGRFDRFFLSQLDLPGILPELGDLLTTLRPDVVHVHHTLLFGVELLFLLRRLRPQAHLVFTLHDYFPICAHEGQMVKAGSHALCRGASPDACHACLPDIPADRFLLREKHIKTLFGLVDTFIAPSRFLRDRFVAWGLPADRIVVLPNGRPAVAAPAPPRPTDGPRAVFATFGNISPFKGTMVALAAMERLAEAGDTDARLLVHGDMPFQTEAFRTGFETAVSALGTRVVHRGPYAREDLPALIAGVDWVVVPSIWWENAPLVILEAFQHGRPVLCSDIGGMAEHVRDGIDGLHFRVGDPGALAETMRRAMREPGLWDRLRANAPPVPTIDEMRVSFIEWAAANPEATDTRAVDGMMRAAAEIWPCD